MRSILQLGFTLVELLVVMVVMAIAASVAVPAFTDMMARRRLEGVANELSTDLQYARSQAVADNTDVTLAASGTGGYIISGNRTYKTVTLDTGLTVTDGASVTFTPMRGCTNATCTAADISIAVSNSSGSLRTTVNRLGKVSLCVASGSFGAYQSCS